MKLITHARIELSHASKRDHCCIHREATDLLQNNPIQIWPFLLQVLLLCSGHSEMCYHSVCFDAMMKKTGGAVSPILQTVNAHSWTLNDWETDCFLCTVLPWLPYWFMKNSLLIDFAISQHTATQILQWRQMRISWLKSPATRLFVQKLFQLKQKKKKENKTNTVLMATASFFFFFFLGGGYPVVAIGFHPWQS